MQIRAIAPMFLYYFNIFLKKTFVVSKILFTFVPEMPTHERVGALKLTLLERDLRPFVRPVSKGRFLNGYLSEQSNFATLNLKTAVMQQKRLRGLILYLPTAIISPFYI